MKHAGIHFPENAGGEHPDVATILGMPGIANGCTLICAPSARYWYGACRAASPLVIWRAIPRQGKLPAQLDWNPRLVAAECLNLWDEQPHDGEEWFLPLNELQFIRESGEAFPGYGPTALHLQDLRHSLRLRLPETVKLMFPAWVPSTDGDYLDSWRVEAGLWDGICLHAYGSAETMRARYQSYRDAFPDHPILVGEWNSNHEGHDERASLEMWAKIADTDPLFLGATYYIWETNNAGEQDLSIWGNPDRLTLFQNPPISTPEEPPVPEPVAAPQGIDVASYQGYPDWNAVKESGITFAFTKLSEDTGYVNPTFEYNWVQMKAVGIQRGAYHFARPEGNDATEEADALCTRLINAGFDVVGDMVALDLEAGYGDLGPWTLEFCRRVEERLYTVPIIYTGRWFSEPHNLGDYPEIANYPLWLAAYQPAMPAPPAPWNVVSFWQYSSSGQIPGIVGDVDLNVFNGTAENLPLMGKLPAETPGEPTPPSTETYSVGQGIIDAMTVYEDTPAGDEIGVGNHWTECMGMSGKLYRYVKATGRTMVFTPES
jgi:GH25 family lysozyme M1 (1,4-beta-N-acetylmuramidase)